MTAAVRPSVDAAAMQTLLVDLLRIPSVSGQEAPLTQFVAEWATSNGFEIDLWQADEEPLTKFDWSIGRHLPLAGRPTLVIRLPGTGGGRSLMFNAHADVVAAGDRSAWSHDPWGGEIVNHRVFGRGACDVKGPLVSALWAMAMLRDHPPAGEVMLEVIPGEEDCVGLGTLTSVARGWKADGCVVLEPTESEPRCASRGGLRFELILHGKAVHGTVKWLGTDAIGLAVKAHAALQELQASFNDRQADPLFSSYPFARPITVDTIQGGEWQGMVCDRCKVGGYFELLPGDDLNEWKGRFETELRAALGVSTHFDVQFPETYLGHRTDPMHPICQASSSHHWQGINSGCEAGLRYGLLGTPTLVWGPGSLAQAHAADEYVDFADVQRCGEAMAHFATRWCDARPIGE